MKRFGSLLLCLALSAAAGRVEAGGAEQDPSRSGIVDPSVLAKQEFERGRAAFASGLYEDALTAFLRADQLVPSDVVRFNIAVCSERLGRYDAAIDDYERVAQSSSLPADAQKRAQAALTQLQARLGTLVVEAPPSTLVLSIDDVRCSVPCRRRVTPGLHHVTAITPGGDLSREVVVAARAEVSVRLLAAPTPSPQQPRLERARPASIEPGRGTPARSNAKPTHALFGPIGYVGLGLAAVGGLSFGYFGLRTNALERDYRDTPTSNTRDAGLETRLLANISLGGALLGLSLVAIDRVVIE